MAVGIRVIQYIKICLKQMTCDIKAETGAGFNIISFFNIEVCMPVMGIHTFQSNIDYRAYVYGSIIPIRTNNFSPQTEILYIYLKPRKKLYIYTYAL